MAGRNELIVPENRNSKLELRNSTSEIRNSKLGRAPDHVRGLPSKVIFSAPRGSVLRIVTPGGGGWGKKRSQKSGVRSQNINSKLEIRKSKLDTPKGDAI
jgi:N-methylhydantoinase B/oxoprolinase/acetone carboxylase alpha subunit